MMGNEKFSYALKGLAFAAAIVTSPLLITGCGHQDQTQPANSDMKVSIDETSTRMYYINGRYYVFQLEESDLLKNSYTTTDGYYISEGNSADRLLVITDPDGNKASYTNWARIDMDIIAGMQEHEVPDPYANQTEGAEIDLDAFEEDVEDLAQ